MVADPFFCLKSIVLKSNTSINVKTGSPNFLLRIGFYFHDCGISRCDSGEMPSPIVIQRLRELPTLAILFFARTSKILWSRIGGYSSSHNCCVTIDILQPSQRYVPMK
jgi:hypothetical protein